MYIFLMRGIFLVLILLFLLLCGCNSQDFEDSRMNEDEYIPGQNQFRLESYGPGRRRSAYGSPTGLYASEGFSNGY